MSSDDRNLNAAEWSAELDPARTKTGKYETEAAAARANADPFAAAVSFADLDLQTFRPPAYLVERTVPLGGMTLLSGPPKIGKSHFALGVGLAVAQDGTAFGQLAVT